MCKKRSNNKLKNVENKKKVAKTEENLNLENKIFET